MFRAYDASRDRPVAVKLFTLDLAPERVHQLVAEFERLIAAALDHPALATPLATGTVGVAAYLVHDFFDAQSLDLAVREYGPAPPADALRVAAQLAGGLDFAAAVNVMHGALHPRDVLLSPNETRLTGIGVAQAFEAIGIAAPVRRPFTPPEQIAGAPWDRRADVFSLAGLMYELLFGQRVTGLGAHAVESLPEIPGAHFNALRSAFARALAEDPASRYATALDFAGALNDAFPDVASQPRAGGHESAASAEPLAASQTPPPPRTHDRRPAAPPRLPLDEEVAPVAPGAEARQTPPPPPPAPVELPPVAATADASSLVLNEAEQERYRDVEVAPSLVESDPPPAGPGLVLVPPPPERRIVFWPVAAALAVGLGIGFVGGYGYGVGTGERSAPPAAGNVSPPPPASVQNTPAPGSGMPAATPAAPAAGREFTESAVAEAPKPPPAAAAPPAGGSADTATADPATEIASGRVLVRSTPAGARVFVDGRDYGPTPAAVRELSRGTHQVRVTRDGYLPEERRVVITDARPAQSITVPLGRARAASVAAGNAAPVPSTPATVGRFVGRLVVDSRPSGARVFVDGKLVGNTPLALGDVRAGEHAVRIERDGYRRWSSSVRVVAAEQNKVTASLER